VAGLHVSLPQVLEAMTPEELRDAEGLQTLLLDDEGRVVVHSGLADDATLALGQPFEVPEVLEAVVEHRSGMEWVDTDEGEQIVAFNRLTSNGWTYVLRGASDVMLQ
jgi:hypothetical protein